MKLDQSLSWVAWNIFLATIPVALAYSIAGLASLVKKRPLLKLPLAVDRSDRKLRTASDDQAGAG
jgi:uncharacterized membrane protein